MKEALHTILLGISALFAILAVVVAAMLSATAEPSVEALAALFIPAISFGFVAWTTRKKSRNSKGTANA
ncbi:hypothetical protein [Qipengyuania sp. ASV99]|uniref:hypothetical protein n=1 Tax=Qipengyuania sp. ASV99 TaxID=3399681 RepID=UPI003A4C50B5